MEENEGNKIVYNLLDLGTISYQFQFAKIKIKVICKLFFYKTDPKEITWFDESALLDASGVDDLSNLCFCRFVLPLASNLESIFLLR